MILSHVTIGVEDVERARRFYDPLLELLGSKPRFVEPGWAGWQACDAGRPLFIVTEPFDGRQASVGNGQMVAFMADSRALVDESYALALRLGGVDAGPPGLRPQYHATYYGAYFYDIDGNKLCVCCHE